MLRRIWDSIVEKVVEAVVWAILGSTALMMLASAALLQWTQTPWFWRRFVMAAVMFVGYTSILKFAPRWMIPKVTSRKPELHLHAFIQDDDNTVRVRVSNEGPTDTFVGEVWLVTGAGVFTNEHVNIRWLNHPGENRQIASGAVQYLELLRVPTEVSETEVNLKVFLLLPTTEKQLSPAWVMKKHVTHPIVIHLNVRSATTGESKGGTIHVILAKFEKSYRRFVISS
jgi:hypothetical protein